MFVNSLDDDSITGEEFAANVQNLYVEAADVAWDIDTGMEKINRNLNG